MKLKPMSIAFMTCAAVENDTAGNACWFQTTPPYGKYPSGMQVETADGKKAKDTFVVFSRESVDAVVKDFRERMKDNDWPGLLVDQEHFSMDVDKPSTAMAWAKDIRVADDGSIWTKWEFTAKGKELYEGKMLINRSPVLDLEKISAKEFAPTRLTSIGMTNTPYFKELSPQAAAKENNQKGETTMDPKILEALGLAAEATVDDAVNAINALKGNEAAASAKCEECEKKQEEAEAKCRKLQCDAFVAAHKEQIADEAKFREAYMKAPEATEQALGLFKTAAAAPAPAARIVAKDAQTPKSASGPADANMKARNDAVNAYMAAHKCSFTTAWAACRSADPETFAD